TAPVTETSTKHIPKKNPRSSVRAMLSAVARPRPRHSRAITPVPDTSRLARVLIGDWCVSVSQCSTPDTVGQPTVSAGAARRGLLGWSLLVVGLGVDQLRRGQRA